MVYLKGRLRITPKCGCCAPFDVPSVGEDWYSTREVDGELYFYNGKTPEIATSSYPSSIVTVLSSHSEEI